MDDKRNALLSAARELFLRNTYDHISIRHIARRARVNSALIAYYFGSKNGLFREMVRSYMQTHIDRLNASIDSAEPLALEAFYLNFYQKMPPEMVQLMIRTLFFERSETRQWLLDAMLPSALKTFDLYSEALITGSGRKVNPLAVRVLIQSLMLCPKLMQPLLEELHPEAVDDTFFTDLARLNAEVLSTYFDKES